MQFLWLICILTWYTFPGHHPIFQLLKGDMLRYLSPWGIGLDPGLGPTFSRHSGCCLEFKFRSGVVKLASLERAGKTTIQKPCRIQVLNPFGYADGQFWIAWSEARSRAKKAHQSVGLKPKRVWVRSGPPNIVSLVGSIVVCWIDVWKLS